MLFFSSKTFISGYVTCETTEYFNLQQFLKAVHETYLNTQYKINHL
jgi:hypothetical protein